MYLGGSTVVVLHVCLFRRRCRRMCVVASGELDSTASLRAAIVIAKEIESVEADGNARIVRQSLLHWSSILTAVFVHVIGLSR